LFVVRIDLRRAFDRGLEFVVNEKVNWQFHARRLVKGRKLSGFQIADSA
jgi:hypothetical protein